jgi:hypothetical protein
MVFSDIINKVSKICRGDYTDELTESNYLILKENHQWLCWAVSILTSSKTKQDIYDAIEAALIDSTDETLISETDGNLNEDFPDIECILDLINIYCDKNTKKKLVKKLLKYVDKLDVS